MPSLTPPLSKKRGRDRGEAAHTPRAIYSKKRGGGYEEQEEKIDLEYPPQREMRGREGERKGPSFLPSPLTISPPLQPPDAARFINGHQPCPPSEEQPMRRRPYVPHITQRNHAFSGRWWPSRRRRPRTCGRYTERHSNNIIRRGRCSMRIQQKVKRKKVCRHEKVGKTLLLGFSPLLELLPRVEPRLDGVPLPPRGEALGALQPRAVGRGDQPAQVQAAVLLDGQACGNETGALGSIE
jgi:hypothetical protein